MYGDQMAIKWRAVAVVCGLVDWVRLQLAFDARAINASPVRYLSVQKFCCLARDGFITLTSATLLGWSYYPNVLELY
jgi:hypothetical protein